MSALLIDCGLGVWRTEDEILALYQQVLAARIKRAAATPAKVLPCGKDCTTCASRKKIAKR